LRHDLIAGNQSLGRHHHSHLDLCDNSPQHVNARLVERDRNFDAIFPEAPFF